MEPTRPKHYRFADFELDGTRRLLIKGGDHVALNSKALDLLLTLIERRGEVLSKDDLLDLVWPGQFVEEGNLKVQVSALRKVFGEQKDEHRFILTVPGRGYAFVANTEELGNEIIIESHRVSRVTIEETSAETREGKILNGWSSNRTVTYLVGLLIIMVAAAAWFYLSGARQQGTQAASDPSHTEPAQRIFTTSGGGFPERVTISPDGKTIAYVEGRKNQTSLWLGDTESNNSIQIIPFGVRIFNYLAFAPDGRYLYFTARDTNHPNFRLMRISVFGGAIEVLSPEFDSFFSFSPIGDKLAYIRTDPNTKNREIVISDSEHGNDISAFSPAAPLKAIAANGISWSPDGRTIAVAGTGTEEAGIAIFGFDIETKTVKKIAGPVSNRIVNLVWLSDGRGLLIDRNTSNEEGDGKIWHVSYPSGEMERVTNDTHSYSLFSLSVSSRGQAAVLDQRIDPEIWIAPGGDLSKRRQVLSGTASRAEGLRALAKAPDGKIVFAARSAHGGSIWEVDPATGEQRQLTPTQEGVVDSEIEVSADDRFLVFESNRSGYSAIWRANRDGSGLTQLTTGGGEEPSVSPNSKWVAYTSRQGGTPSLWRIEIEGGQPMQLSKQQCSWPAVSPDGKYIACARGRPEGSSDVTGGIGVMRSDGGEFVNTFALPFTSVLYNRLRWAPDGKAIIYKDVMQGLWRQDLNGKPAEHLPELEDFRVVHLAASSGDLIFSGGRKMRDMIILDPVR